jgi:RNA polymerase sigma factor (sigma-70 family)
MSRIFNAAFNDMEEKELLPSLFRTEYQKIVSVLCYKFGIQHIEIAEDIVSDTFLSATELWREKGLPENPVAWLYTVAKNKTKNHLKRSAIYDQKLVPEIKRKQELYTDGIEIDWSEKNIADSQLAMIFAVCNPCNPVDAQVALALNLLCGFGIPEISEAYLTNREVVYKRIQRAKQKLKDEDIKIEPPSAKEISGRLEAVLTTLYLLFSEGYYSSSQNTVLRKDFCAEAIRLAYLLAENRTTNSPEVNALLSLMCFHSSRFEARIDARGEIVLYEDQDEALWDTGLIEQGALFLSKASTGNTLSKYHLEAGIAYWHTQKEDVPYKWEQILQLYNSLLILEYSPIAALNRTFALGKARGKREAITEAEKLELVDNHFYFSLLGSLYMGIDNEVALRHFRSALELAKLTADKTIIRKNIEKLSLKN